MIPLPFVLSSCFSASRDEKLIIRSVYIDKKTVHLENKKHQYDALYVCFNRLLKKEDLQCEYGPTCSHHLRFKFKFSNGKIKDWYTAKDLGHLSKAFGNHDYLPQKCFSIYTEPYCYEGYNRFNDCVTKEIFEKGKVSDLIIEYYWQNKTKGTNLKKQLVQTYRLDQI